MGNQTAYKKQQLSTHATIYDSVLKHYQIYQNQQWGSVRSIAHGGKLTLFSKITKNTHLHSPNNNQPLIILNHQTLFIKHNTSSPQIIDHFKPIIAYYLKRQYLTSSQNQSPTINTQANLIKLLNFSIKNQTTNQIIYPQLFLNEKQDQTSKKQNLTTLSTCGFKQIWGYDDEKEKQPSINYQKRNNMNMYTITFIHEFYPESLQNEIKFRAQNNQFFREKQIWSILYCCCKQAQKMINNGLKQPVLSPAAIFITQNCEIKVGQWEFINYYFSQQESHKNSIFQDEGQTLVTNDLEMTLNNKSSHTENNQDILTTFYWPPQGLVEMQNILRLGEIEKKNDQKLSEAKNAQVFCLAMTILQMLTLKPYYQKSTYSEKQLTKLIQQAVQIRQAFGQPISQEIVDLLLQMLQWDPEQRFQFQDVLEYIHQIFQSNEEIFKDSANFQSESSRTIKISDVSYFKTDRRQTGSLVTEISMDPFLARVQESTQNQVVHKEEGLIKNVNFTVSLADNSQMLQNGHEILLNRQIDSKKDCLLDSGVICQGMGDDYNPDHSEEQQEKDSDYEEKIPNKRKKIETSSRLAFLSPIQIDHSDDEQIQDYQMQVGEQCQTPDQDADYEQEDTDQNQNAYQDQLQQFKQFHHQQSAQKPFILIQNELKTEGFKVNQYVPVGWKSQHQYQRPTFTNEIMSPSFNETLDFMRSNDLKMLNPFANEENIMKKNIKIELSPQISIKPLELQNFSSIVKQVTSPFPSAKVQIKQNSPPRPYDHENDNIFTSPNIMEMIREFTKKQSQQTPNFQNIQLPLTKPSYFETDSQLSKKLSFESKSPTFNESGFKSFGDGISSQCFSLSKNQPIQVKQIQSLTKKEEIQREQFSKGWYEGAKKNGARNGFGTFYYKQGGKYSGYWYNNKMDGHGTLYYPDGRIAYQGQWQNDSLHGKGILLNENPKPIAGSYDFRSFDECQNEECWTSYDGWFENDQKSGFGELLLSNNQKYVGEFKNDMVNGRGKFYKIDGTVFEGVWQNNQLIINP